MDELVKFPISLAAMLEAEDVTWYQVWKPLSKAIKASRPVELSFNISGYQYKPDTDEIIVCGLLEADAEVHLNKDNFRQNMARFLRGTPEC